MANLFSFLFSALRGAATLKARAMKEVLNIAAVLPMERGTGGPTGGKGNKGHRNNNYSGELSPGEDFLTACSQELLAKGAELLKRTRKGDLRPLSVHKIFHLLECNNPHY